MGNRQMWGFLVVERESIPKFRMTNATSPFLVGGAWVLGAFARVLFSLLVEGGGYIL